MRFIGVVGKEQLITIWTNPASFFKIVRWAFLASPHPGLWRSFFLNFVSSVEVCTLMIALVVLTYFYLKMMIMYL